MKKSFFSFSRIEKILFFLFILGFFLGGAGIIRAFFVDNSHDLPGKGGVYREGMVGNGNGLLLNPVFLYGKKENALEADISHLVFAGLMRYNTQTGQVEDYLASHQLSSDKKTYFFKLKEGLFWHDGTPLTSDDIIFTYQTILQNEAFTNEVLKAAFAAVKIQKINDMEVSFEIPIPYKFFLTNFTLGLLPKHLLENVNVADLEYDSFFSAPIGNGPYQYISSEEVRPGVSKITLRAFHQSSAFDPNIETVEFHFFPSFNALFLDAAHLSAMRPFLRQKENIHSFPDQFTQHNFVLPQYISVFFNLKKPIFSGKLGELLRVALQISFDKENFLNGTDGAPKIPGMRVDTPLLETKIDEWLYVPDSEKANGALKDAGWLLPSKFPKVKIPEKSESSFIVQPTKEATFETTEDVVNFSGEMPTETRKILFFVDGSEKKVQEIPAPPAPQEGQPEGQLSENTETKKTWEFVLKREELGPGNHGFRIKFSNEKGEVFAEDALSFFFELPSFTESQTAKGGEIRVNRNQEPLKLSLVTEDLPSFYAEMAQYLAKKWRLLGIDVELSVLEPQEFSETVEKREYDMLLFGQNLGYNPDIYEFFHESQIGKRNLSDYQSPKASVLIEEIRASHNMEIREKKLKELRNVLKEDLPAIFLLSPEYVYLTDRKVKGVDTAFAGVLKDRFSTIDHWYIQTNREWNDNVSWKNFFPWLVEKI